MNQQPSTSKTQNNELSIKITNSMSLAPKSGQQIIYKRTETEATGKHDSDYDELTLRTRKKIKTGSIGCEIEIVNEDSISEGDVCREDDSYLSDTSFAVSGENECTTPEYLYDELLDENNESAVIENEESYESENEQTEFASTVDLSTFVEPDLYELSDDEVNMSNTIPEKTTQNNQTRLPTLTKNIKPGILKSNIQTKNTGLSRPVSKISNATEKSPWPALSDIQKGPDLPSGVPKYRRAPRINDKYPELPVPPHINQYGDCLKTRLGRYHYGLTLSDPPSQFFQGVLKGASGQTLAVMFGDTNLISKFEKIPMDEIGHFAIDTTFSVIPDSTDGINNVLTINLLYQNMTIPLWYAVTSCSSPELYKRIIIEFQQHVLDWPFSSVLLNNDPALCKAVLALFPDIDYYGSWFHYCHSIWKELSFHKLAENCRTDQILMTGVKLLMAIPYLPPVSETPSSITMLEGFEVVKQYARLHNLPKEFIRVMDFVAAFWFNKVKTKNFTVFGKQTLSLNYVEIMQLCLLSYMKPNGNIWTLTRSFQLAARSSNMEFNRFLNGKPLLSKKNRGKKYNVPIRQNMKKLMMGTFDVKTFLEKSTVYCEEMLDIFLHPLYPLASSDRNNYVNAEGWKTKIINS